jgi:hypothetical protein
MPAPRPLFSATAMRPPSPRAAGVSAAPVGVGAGAGAAGWAGAAQPVMNNSAMPNAVKPGAFRMVISFMERRISGARPER